MAEWSFLTNHARVLLCIAHDPAARLRDIADTLGITERSAYGIVTDLTRAGYLVKERDGRRNRYQIQPHQPLREPTTRERTVGEVLEVLVDPASQGRPPSSRAPGPDPSPVDRAPIARAGGTTRAGRPGSPRSG